MWPNDPEHNTKRRVEPKAKMVLPTWESSRATAAQHASRLEGVLHSRKTPLPRGRALGVVAGLVLLGCIPAFVLSRQAPLGSGAIPRTVSQTQQHQR